MPRGPGSGQDQVGQGQAAETEYGPGGGAEVAGTGVGRDGRTTLVAITNANATNAAWLSEEITRPAGNIVNEGPQALSAPE
ncbi:hypothetical protein [Streptomyces noursei]|uniref:hypothetical protein n=1 Tax=Streptomyces noursei TaxID=1971 RepID=UPI0038153DDA